MFTQTLFIRVGTEEGTRSLMCAREVLCHSYTSMPLLLFIWRQDLTEVPRTGLEFAILLAQPSEADCKSVLRFSLVIVAFSL